MNARGASYAFDGEHRGRAEELARLASQVDLTWPAELEYLRRLDLPEEASVVELGCGPGYVLQRLSEAYPNARLTGLDIDAELLAEARTADPAGEVDWVAGDLLEASLPAGSFDLALARYVFQHLADPAAAARELARLLRPGGRAVVLDVDAELWGVAQPTFPEVVPIHVKHGRAQASRGGDRRIGRRLPALLRAAGFEDVRLDLLSVSSDEIGLEPFLPQLDPDRQLVSRRAGVLTDAEMEILRDAHRRFLADPDAFVMMVVCVATGRMPR